jgi:dipeptide/tripeptide permease
MRILWTLFKVIAALAIAIPLGIFALALTGVVVGTLVGLAFFALRLAVIGFVGYGLFRLARHLFWSDPVPVQPLRELPLRDPYYDAAMRELDSELGGRR